MSTSPDIDILIEVSRRYGGDPAYLLAGGGNTSVKHGERLWVKASGHALADITADGFVELDRNRLDAMLDARWPEDSAAREAAFVEAAMAARVHPELNQRPSVEALLHHLLPDQYVVHTHPRIVNAISCCKDGSDLSSEILGGRVLWQPYVDPGLILAKSMHKAIKQYTQANAQAPEAIILANHGLIVSGDKVSQIDDITQSLIGKIDHAISSSSVKGFSGKEYPQYPDLLELHQYAAREAIANSYTSTEASDQIQRLVGFEGGRDAALSGPLLPDHIVYCRSFPMWINNPASNTQDAIEQWQRTFQAYNNSYGFEPWLGLIAGVGMISIRDSQLMADITRDVYLDAAHVYFGATRLGGIKVLGKRERQFIEHWEVEAYRRNIAEVHNYD